MRHLTRGWALAMLAIVLANSQSQAQMQSSAARPTNVFSLFAEPLAAGFQYGIRTNGGLHFGAEIVGGPQFGVNVAHAVPDVRAWASAHAVLAFRFTGGAELTLSPVGASAVIGDDFGAVYPSGQFGAGIPAGRVRLTSLLRVIRIAGSNGSGTYWTQWIPLRVSYSLGSR